MNPSSEKPASSKILRAIVALLAWAVFALFIAEHAEAGQWEDCASNVESYM